MPSPNQLKELQRMLQEITDEGEYPELEEPALDLQEAIEDSYGEEEEYEEEDEIEPEPIPEELDIEEDEEYLY
jgi:hypothetical protein